MLTSIEIIPSIKEKRIPYIKLSKSKDGKTGSATFVFIKPKSFIKEIACNSTISFVALLYKNKKILSQHTEIYFKEGKPFILKAFFIFTNKEEYLLFFNFINLYAKEYNLTYLQDQNNKYGV
jgi:photosystem II protein